MRRVIRVTVSPLRMANARRSVVRATIPPHAPRRRGEMAPLLFQEGCAAMCKGKAIAKRAPFGSDRVGGDPRVVNDPTFELARRSWKLRFSDMASDAGQQMDCGRRGVRAAAARSQTIVPSL